MDTSRTHLIVRLCRAVLVGWLTVLAASCTAASTTPAPVAKAAATHYRWHPRDAVAPGYLEGIWATGELSFSTLRGHLVQAGLARCASSVARGLARHQLILSASGDNWTLVKTGAPRSEVLARGSYSARVHGPASVRLSLISVVKTELSGNGSLMLGGAHYNIVDIRMRPLDSDPSCVTAAEAIAWFLMPFAKTSVR